MEFWIWLIIIIVVAIVKGIGKLQSAGQSAPDTPAPPRRRRPPSRPAPPVRTPPMARPKPAVAPSAPPRRTGPGGWRVEPETLREFVSQLDKHFQPPQPAAPPVPAAVPAQPVAAPAPMPAKATATPPTPRRRSRAARWSGALRDRQNIRNIVVAAEIIGPPKSLKP